MTQGHPDNELDPDIQEALTRIRQEGQAPDGASLPSSGETAVVSHYDAWPTWLWQLKSAATKILAVTRQHPWRTSLAITLSVASSVFVCLYCGWLLMGGLVVYVVRCKR